MPERNTDREREPLGTRRAAGILLHPTSLPGPHGVGELGPEALSFVSFLREAGQGLWQVLPLGPTDRGGSPYSSYSAFAGNPLLVSTDGLVEDGLLSATAMPEAVPFDPVDYPATTARKGRLLREAFARWEPDAAFGAFREEHAGWLGDYALYAALKEAHAEAPWTAWEDGLSRREPDALRRAGRGLSGSVRFHEFVQHRFFGDWARVKGAANDAGVAVMGDVPIFVSHDSADVWANQGLFSLDEDGEPTVVAGVPPDYFSETGQLWGNPLYRWDRMREDGYAWWAARMRSALTLCDMVRVDHFRGFEAYWEVPAGAETAKGGRWVKGPGADLFAALRRALGDLPLVAEDLGDISPEVVALREELGLPGMKVLQFAFGEGPTSPFLPHNHRGDNWVAYTGTHDNDTAAGWWASAGDEERRFARRYVGREFVSVWDLIRLAYSSPAHKAIVPMQDALELGSEARTNTPGTATGNWSWRMEGDALTPDLARRLKDLAETYGR